MSSKSRGQLERRLSTGQATVIGLGSMVGAGVFASFGAAAGAAGKLLLVSLVIAGFLAFANATSSAQLAAQHPTSGGTYVYGNRQLGHWWGFAAGWSFLTGKTASCAAIALTFGAYVAPDHARWVAAAAVLALTIVNILGISRTATVTAIVLAITLTAIAAVLIGAWISPDVASDAGDLAASEADTGNGFVGVLRGAGLLFFAFAGYARIATMGEEVRDPRRAIPRAIIGALGAAALLYAVIGATLLTQFGSDGLAASAAPLRDLVAGSPVLSVIAQIGAATATLGSLLGLLAGLGRTGLAMAREGDLPRGFAWVEPRHSTPAAVEVTVAAIVIALVFFVDLTWAIGASSFAVLLYYAIANVSAFTQREPHRMYPRALHIAGAIGCVIVACFVPVSSLIAGAVVLMVGLFGRLGVRMIQRKTSA